MKTISLTLAAVGTILFASCATENSSPSGFLGNYSSLGPDLTRMDYASVFLDPTADIKSYDSMIVETVQLIPGATEISELERAQVAARLQVALRRELDKDYEIVTVPGVKTMRLRVALVGNIAADTAPTRASFTYPAATVRSDLPAPSETAQQLGKAGIELEILDAKTGQRLVAIADKQIGDLRPDAPTESWPDITKLMDLAGLRVRQGLDDLRARILP